MPSIDPVAAGLSKDGLARLDTGIAAAAAKHEIPGGVVLIARQGRIAHFVSFGVSDRDTQRPMRKDDIFRIYSMTKPVVSVALLTLYEQGKFQLDDPLEKYIPEFKNLKVYAGENKDGEMLLADPKRKPTIQDAFRHTTCIGAGGGPAPVAKLYFDRKIWVNRMNTLQEEMELIGGVPLLCQPGEAWVYGYDHDVQAHLVEYFSGMPLAEYLQKRLFDPLQMSDTGYGVPDGKRDRVVRLHDVPEEMPAYPAVDMRPSTYERFADHPFGTLGLWSTASDYARFSQMLLNGGELDGARILGKKTVELMTANNLPPAVGTLGPAQGNFGTGYGLGVSVQLDVAADANLGSPGAFGWDGAATTRFIVDPEEDMVAILMMQKAPFDARMLSEFQTLVYQSIGK
ncbi:MAG: beta-lactamase family protein [Altererythrobacter sp.]|nr:beta-lactamase family protein [Altererythrobacter sp.]